MNRDKIENISIKTPEEKSGEPTIVTVNDQTFTASTQSGAISQALEYLDEETTPENIVEFIELAVKGKTLGNPVSSDATGANWPSIDEQPMKPVRKRKEKIEKKPKKTTFVGKLYTDKEGEVVYEVIEEIPPTDWRFTLIDLRVRIEPGLAEPKIFFNLKEFKHSYITRVAICKSRATHEGGEITMGARNDLDIPS